MQAGSLVVSDAMFYASRVLVNGVERECASWSVGRELSGDLPAQVAAVSGLVQATGTIVWVEEYDVDEMPTTPFNTSSGWLPRRGNRVEIFAGDGVSEWKVFTGLVDSSSGSVGESFQSTIIDDRDKLDKPFTHDALLRVMPPLTRGASAYRGVGLTYLYFVDAALRTAGFYATPSKEARQALSVPAQSSMWPEVGLMTEGVVGGTSLNPSAWCSTHNSVDGVVVSNVSNTYSPNLANSLSDMCRFSMTVDPSHAGTAIMLVSFGATTVQLSVASSRTVVARLNGVEIARLVMGSAVRVSLLKDGDTWTLRTDTGVTATATMPASSPAMSAVKITADANSRVAGFHVCHPTASTRWAYTDFVPTAKYSIDDLTLFGVMDASPAIAEGSAFELLEGISQATLSAMWIDEHGVFRWAPSTTLAAGSPVRELNTADDILSLPWEDNLLGTRSKVTARYRVPAVSRSRWDNILWYQGGAETLESNQEKNEFISPEADKDWIGEPSALVVLGDAGSSIPANSGQGSLTGAQLTDDSTEVLGNSYLTASLTKVNGTTYKLKNSVGTLPAGKQLELRYPTVSSTIRQRWLKEPLPIIRGFAETSWTDAEVVGTPAGPSWAPVLEHEAGPWLSREEEIETVVLSRLVNYLADQTSVSLPTIGSMQITPDPRLQLGDRVTIRSNKYVGAVFTAIITGINLDAGDSFSQQISVRLTSLDTTFETYDGWNAQYPGVLTYDQWAALTSMTYNQFAVSKE